MNRRSLFSFLAAVPFVGPAIAKSGPPVFEPRMLKDRDDMFEAMKVRHPKFAFHSPDWRIYGTIIPCDPVEDLTDETKPDFVFAWVTDEIFWTREACRAGFTRVRDWTPRIHIDTGLPQAFFMKRHSYNGKPLEKLFPVENWDLEAVHHEIDHLQAEIQKDWPEWTVRQIDVMDRIYEIQDQLRDAEARLSALTAAAGTHTTVTGRFDLADRDKCRVPRTMSFREAMLERDKQPPKWASECTVPPHLLPLTWS